MPLQVNYTDPNTGTNASNSYWIIRSANLNTISNNCDVMMDGYSSLAAKNAGKYPFYTAVYSITFASLGITNNMTIAQLQTAIYNNAITGVEVSTNTVLLSGGVIV